MKRFINWFWEDGIDWLIVIIIFLAIVGIVILRMER